MKGNLDSALDLEMTMRRQELQMLMLKFNQVVIKVMDQIPNFLEEVFAPRLVIKQVLLATALHGAMMGVDGVYKLIVNIWMHYVSGVGRKMFRLEKKMTACTNYKDWLTLAKQHDELSGKMKWRKEDRSPLIDAKGLRRRIREVNYFVEKDDPIALKFRLSGHFSRNQFGVQHEEMHSYAMSGTKRVVIEYNDAMQLVREDGDQDPIMQLICRPRIDQDVMKELLHLENEGYDLNEKTTTGERPIHLLCQHAGKFRAKS